MVYLYIFIAWFAWSLFHARLLKYIPYRWVVNSILYPLHRARLKRQLLLNTMTQTIDMWYRFNSKWFAKYWFGRSLLKIIDDRILELDKRNENVIY